MPKISNNKIGIQTKDIKKTYDVQIMYNQDNLFYAKIDPEFDALFDHAADETLKKFNAKGYNKGREFARIVTGDTEPTALSNVKKFYEHFLQETIQKRDVIIVFFKGDDKTYYHGHYYNSNHPQIGMKFGLTYAVETTSGDKKVYNQYITHSQFGSPETTRKEINLWNELVVIIDDTPENRTFLETLYNAFNDLNQKMKDFTGSSEKLLALIASKQPLLPYSNQ